MAWLYRVFTQLGSKYVFRITVLEVKIFHIITPKIVISGFQFEDSKACYHLKVKSSH